MGHRIIFSALVLACAPLIVACADTGPRTHLDWGVNTTRHSHVARAYGTQQPRPTPRPAPDYVTRNATPYAPVTSQALPPIGVAAANAPAFAWPVSGRVISEFGSTASGGKNDGINIATTMAAPIHASASGTVTYAGDELKNYGNLVLVKHSGGFTTAYAHADRLVVSRGEFVAKGQVIGYAGQTGDVASPQVHFEIRSATTPVNPRTYLSSATASN